MGKESIRVTSMEFTHVRDVVQVHLKSFPNFFLTFLGPRFLYLLYSEILTTQDHVAFVALDKNEKILGFVLGVTDQTSLYSRLARKRWLQFAFAATTAALKKPSIILRLFRALGYSDKSQSASASALLMSIAVLPESSGQGVGGLLITTFLKEMKKKSVPAVCLTTDKDENANVNKFYKNFGFSLVKTYVTPEGRWMNEYCIHLHKYFVEEQ